MRKKLTSKEKKQDEEKINLQITKLKAQYLKLKWL